MSNNKNIYSPSYWKLAQLYTAINQRFNIEEVDGILQSTGNINHRFPSNPCLNSYQPELIGSTILHFAMSKNSCDIDIFELLLNYGADYTLKNAKGLTALHETVKTTFNKNKNSWTWKSKFVNKHITAVLKRQVDLQDSTNPVSSDGISHFHVACMTNHLEAVTLFLENGISVNEAISMTSYYFPGYTPLHFAVRFCAVETIKILLQFNAKLDIPDARGMCPIHIAIKRKIEISHLINIGEKKLYKSLPLCMNLYEKVMKELLEKSTYSQKNYVDSIGISHFHIVCAMEDSSMIEKCLKQVYNINHFVNLDSPVWPGYTALHFAALFNVKIVQILLKSGANIEAKDAKGITPFDICLESYSLTDIQLVISEYSTWKNILFSDGKTKLIDIIIDMSRSNSKKKFEKMNICLPFDSTLWPCYTPLHIAVIFANRKKDKSNYKLYYKKDKKRIKKFEPKFQIPPRYLAGGINLNAQDTNGSTPLNLAFRLQKTEIVKNFISTNRSSIANSVDNNSLSHLHIATAFDDIELVKKLLKTGAAVDMQVEIPFKCLFKSRTYGTCSTTITLAKGSTALHIAAAKNNHKLLEILLNSHADIYTRDANGMTAVHRLIISEECFDEFDRSNKQLLSNFPELKDCTDNSYNLSHLHVACFCGDKNTVNKLLDQGADINAVVKSVDSSDESLEFLDSYEGLTPLYFALKNCNFSVCKVLIERGADIFARSVDDIPLLYVYLERPAVFSILEEYKDLRQWLFENTGLTMLHFVCNNVDVDFENFGKWVGENDINVRSHDDSPLWPGCTPLDVFVKSLETYDKNDEDEDEWEESGVKENRYFDTLIESGFLENGANVTLVNGSNTTAILELDSYVRAFKEEIIENYETDDSTEYPMPYDYYEDRNFGHDYYDSYEEKPDKKIKVKCVWNKSSRQKDERVPSYGCEYNKSQCMRALMKGHEDFNVNPVNAKGMSHFHVACLHKLSHEVKQFLQHKVDVNSAISLFSDEFPGCTPLHLAMISYVNSNLTQLLLNYGANVHARDVYGNTPLHFATKNSEDLKVFQMIIEKGADINARNSFGETPLNIALNSYEKKYTFVAEIIKLFIERGYGVNSFNPIDQKGWLPIAFTGFTINNFVTERVSIYEIIASAPDLIKLDNFGRTPIHNLASYSYTSTEGIRLLKTLSKRGCDVDHQDAIGRSALHIAVQFANVNVVTELLKLGADINLKDSKGKVPLAYCFEASTLLALRRTFNNDCHSNKQKYISIIKIFLEHVCKLQLILLDVREENRVLLDNRSDKNVVVDCSRFREQFSRSKEKIIQYQEFSFKLHDMLSETKIVACYPRMLQIKRQAIDTFFISDDVDNLSKELDELCGFLKLQYKKALERGFLVTEANKSLNALAGFIIPDLLLEMIMNYLSNIDLRNLTSL